MHSFYINKNKSHLPSLYKIQESHLIIPATSAGIERAFSTAGLILNDRRNYRLTDKMFEQMLVAKFNGDLMSTATEQNIYFDYATCSFAQKVIVIVIN